MLKELLHHAFTPTLAAAVFAVGTVSTAPVMAASPVQRVSGPDRIATAIATAKAAYSHTPKAILATANDWPDSITSTVLATHLGAPVLLTAGPLLDKRVFDTLEDLGVEEVTVLGGTKAMSEHIVEALEASGRKVTRISGASRAETAAQVALSVRDQAKTVVISAGWGDTAWTNAIAGSNFSYTASQAPTLLVAKDTVPPATKDAIASLGTSSAIVIGDTKVVSNKVVNELKELGLSVRRLEAANPASMSSKAVHENIGGYKSSEVVIASTKSFADALGASALAASTGAPLLLTNKDSFAESTSTLLSGWPTAVDKVTLIGGEAAISAKVANSIATTINKANSVAADASRFPSASSSASSESTTQDRYNRDDENIMVDSSHDVDEDHNYTVEDAAQGNGEAIDVNHVPGSQEYWDQLAADGTSLGTEYGVASYYWQDEVTANGEAFDTWAYTAAHKTLPFNTMVKVTNLKNNKSVIVRINDRGPYIDGRIIDLSTQAATDIGMVNTGVADVRVDIIKFAGSK